MLMRYHISKCYMYTVYKYITCTRFRNRRKTRLWWAFHSCFEVSINNFYISPDNVLIFCFYTAMSCMQKKKRVRFTHKNAEILNILVQFLTTVQSMFDQCLLCFALHKMMGTSRLYVSNRNIKQRFIPLHRQ
jgi:hypothetical protein